MDIFEIIKSSLPELPEGVTISDKTIKAMEKEIKAQQALIFVPKNQYAKKTDRIAELEAELSEAQGKAADGDSYKEKLAKLEDEYKNYKATKETEFTDYKAQVEAEKTAAAKKTALHKHLAEAGANTTLIGLLEKGFDLAKLELDGDKIKDWNKLLAPVKEQYADIFGTVTTQGTQTVAPPTNNVGVNPFAKETRNLQQQTELFRKDPLKARQMAAAVGIILPQ